MTVPRPFAEGTVTDDERDPSVARASDHSHVPEDSDLNPFQLPQYQRGHTPPPPSESRINGWVLFIVIIILLNVILIPLTGHAIIPR